MIKTADIFEKGHNKGWEKIEKWIEGEDVCAKDFMTLVCAKFAQLPQVKRGELVTATATLMVAGDIYEIEIRRK